MNRHFNRVTDAPDSRRCSVEGNVPRESSRRFQARQLRDCLAGGLNGSNLPKGKSDATPETVLDLAE